MPQIPIIIPLVVAGVAVGSVIKSKSPTISKRKLLSASLVAGFLNAIYAYAVYSFSPEQTFTFSRGTFPAAPTSWIPFVVASLLAGFLIVLAVLGIAMAYARIRRGGEEELAQVPELASEGESALGPS